MAVVTERFRAARLRMVSELCERNGIRDKRLLEVLRQVERHRFVDPAWHARAYGPNQVPIGAGQVLPHPHMVALSIQALHLDGDDSVLEIGTGSGYQAALLGQLAASVISTECFASLARRAVSNLAAAGVENVEVRCQTGLRAASDTGFDTAFNAILVTGAVPEVPGQLLSQLAPGGRLVLPVGRGLHQRLLLLLRRARQQVVTHTLGCCAFHELLGPGSRGFPGQAHPEPL